MRLLRNSGTDRGIDHLREWLVRGADLDIVSPAFSLLAFAELRELLDHVNQCRLMLGDLASTTDTFFGDEADVALRGRLQTRWLARLAAEWIIKHADVRYARKPPSQSLIYVAGNNPPPRAMLGICSFTTEGLGLIPGDPLGFLHVTETELEAADCANKFQLNWDTQRAGVTAKSQLVAQLEEIASPRAPALVYFQILHQVFKDMGDELDEDRIIKSATGIRDSVVWNKLFRFQRDGVIGAIDKLERIGGCIIADSVGLGKTFEALAVVKYYELRNDRVLVLCPKRLRDNWTLYKANDRRNFLAPDRLHYDVLNHTDLSREGGTSGDIELSHVNWGNYDLVVIDESHNFRNKPTHTDRESRYDRLMQRVIQAGVKTKVLMLSATPVNNGLMDLKNQISFMTEGNDAALTGNGIPSIKITIMKAQAQFRVWLKLPEKARKPALLMDMLGFDYFKLLDMLTIARSRKHIQRYYGLDETGQFPVRLTPLNIKADVDRVGAFRPIREINNEIRRLSLGAYALMQYILPAKLGAYEDKYDTALREGEGAFRQIDRETSMIHLLRVNILKRMESSVASFALTIERQLADIDTLLARIDAHRDEVEEISIADDDIDDPEYETLLVGKKVKVLLQDMDRVRWRQDLMEDRARLATLLGAAKLVAPERDDKLEKLKQLIIDKLQNPINPGNRKFLLFTAFADTANYLYRELSPWARDTLRLHSAVICGTGTNKSNLPKLRNDMGTILSAFSPISKERPEQLQGEGEIDLLIATDCISEGQNLQDCDYLINYDIHWNPVRIIQRFGRIDRIGSRNSHIQLVNFWPNMELDEYLDLETRVKGRMMLLDVSATGEEDMISPNDRAMNDLEYRRTQLKQMQEKVIDLEDLSSGVSIADLTLGDFRTDLTGFLRNHKGELDALPPGTYAVTETDPSDETPTPPGVIFCLRAVGPAAQSVAESGYPLAPHYVVHAGMDGEVLLPYTQAKQVLDRLKKLSIGHDQPDPAIYERFDKATRAGRDMDPYRKLLARAVGSLVGKREERAVASLFQIGGTHAIKGEFAGIDDFEVVAFLIVLPSPAGRQA